MKLRKEVSILKLVAVETKAGEDGYSIVTLEDQTGFRKDLQIGDSFMICHDIDFNAPGKVPLDTPNTVPLKDDAEVTRVVQWLLGLGFKVVL